MKNIKWNEYTWYSKLAAIIFFIAILPVWTFYMGIQYSETKSAIEYSQSVQMNTTISKPEVPNSKVSEIYQCPKSIVGDAKMNDHTVTYSNSSVAFKIQIPSLWYIPNSTESTPTFYKCLNGDLVDTLQFGDVEPGRNTDGFDHQISATIPNATDIFEGRVESPEVLPFGYLVSFKNNRRLYIGGMKPISSYDLNSLIVEDR